MRWNARIGVWIFLIAPFFLFFSVGLPLLADLPTIVWYGLAVPLLYAIYLVVIIFLSIRKKFKGSQNSLEAILTYSAAVPWVLLPLFGYVDTSQFGEVVCTNAGFIIITFLFSRRMIYDNRKVFEKLNDFDQKEQVESGIFFERRCSELGLSKRWLRKYPYVSPAKKSLRYFLFQKEQSTNIFSQFSKRLTAKTELS